MEIPIWEKAYLTLNEASAYTNIGVNKLRELIKDAPFILWVGGKRLIKREELIKFLDDSYSV